MNDTQSLRSLLRERIEKAEPGLRQQMEKDGCDYHTALKSFQEKLLLELKYEIAWELTSRMHEEHKAMEIETDDDVDTLLKSYAGKGRGRVQCELMQSETSILAQRCADNGLLLEGLEIEGEDGQTRPGCRPMFLTT